MYVVEFVKSTGSVYIAESVVPINGKQSLPILRRVPSFSRALNMTTGAMENSSVTIDILDIPQFRDQIIGEDLVGCPLVLYQNTDLIAKMQITGFPQSQKGGISLKADVFSILDVPISPPLTADIFPNCPMENLGKIGNIILGNANITYFEALRVSTNQYLASWESLSEISSVIDTQGNNITGSCTISIDPMTGYTYITYTSPTEEKSIKFKGRGPTESGSLVENPARMVQWIIEKYSDMQVDDGSFDTAAEIFGNRLYVGNIIFINTSWTWIDFFREVGKSFNCYVFVKRDGMVSIKVLSWGNESPVSSIHPAKTKNFSFIMETRDIAGTLQRRFLYDPIARSFGLTPTDFTVNPRMKKMVVIDQMFVVVDLTSFDVAAREAFFRKKRTIRYTVEIPHAETKEFDIGDTIWLRHRGNPMGDTYRLGQVIRETRTNNPFVQIEVVDLTEIIQGVFVLCEEGDPNAAVLGESDGPTLL